MPRLLTGLAFGAAGAFLLDPEQGRRRRALLRDKMVHAVNQSREFADAAAKDLRSRAQGITARARSLRTGETPDDVLAARVRAKLGRYSSHPGAIEVAAHNGRVVLTGDILVREQQSLFDAVRSLRGVEDVENKLTAHASADGISALQGGAEPDRERFELAQQSWTPGVRALAGGAGAVLVLYALARGRLAGIGALALGAALLTRSAANRPLAPLVGARRRETA
jgi:BON domain